MKQTFKNVNANKVKEAMAKNVAKLEKKYVDQFGQESMNNYMETTSKVVSSLVEGVKKAYERLCLPNSQFTAVKVEFMGKSRAVVIGIKKEDGSINFKVCSNKENIPTYSCDLFNAIFSKEVVDLAFGELKYTSSNIELVPLKEEYNDINKFYNGLVDTMFDNAGDDDQVILEKTA